jgi:hypothetical protein
MTDDGYWRYLLLLTIYVSIIIWPIVLLTCPHHLYRLWDWVCGLFERKGGPR